ncbi:MAG TPA: hypothetical protein DCQ06_03735 [Myxococcales bacterium]|nr:hypothetical protein [Myxococcales bacterium]HAN30687.1 hypothetical protein [Myxococcales bacterium]
MKTKTTVVLILIVGLCSIPHLVGARGARGAKKLAMKRFDASSREVKVIASHRSGAALVRLQTGDVPVCHLMKLNTSPARATSVLNSVRLSTCATYDKEARSARLKEVKLTSRTKAYQVFILSKRMDAIAKGVEIRRMWGLYQATKERINRLFERTSTSFKSQVNKAINQSEVCEAPVIAQASTPGPLTLKCLTETMLGGAVKRKTNTYRYIWSEERYMLQ